MEQTNVAAPATSMAPAEMPASTMRKQDHWLIQVVGGLTLANTMVSSLAVFWIFLEYGI
jgi:hypothetical protein